MTKTPFIKLYNFFLKKKVLKENYLKKKRFEKHPFDFYCDFY
jgi:hypothetical protein